MSKSAIRMGSRVRINQGANVGLVGQLTNIYAHGTGRVSVEFRASDYLSHLLREPEYLDLVSSDTPLGNAGGDEGKDCVVIITGNPR